MTTAVTIAPTPILQFFSNTGAFNANGTVLTQVGGINYQTFQDSAGLIPLPNPIPLNSRGEISNSSGLSCQLFLQQGIVYTFTVFDSNGNQLDQAQYVTQPAPPSAASVGLLFYPQSAAESAASITPTSFYYIWGDVRRYGAILDGATNNTAALTSAVAQAIQAGGASIYFPPGNCVGTLTIGSSVGGLHIRGDGALRSILTAVSGSADAIAFTAGTTVFNVIIEGLQISAPGTAGTQTAGSGIHFPTGMSAPPFTVVYRDLFISGFGRSGIWDQAGCFTTYAENVSITQTGNHNFDLMGGNSCSLRNCYAFGPLPLTLTFSSTLSSGQTSNALSSPWIYPTGTYIMITPAGDTVAITLTNGGTSTTFGALTNTANLTATLGTAGYRVHTGVMTLISCNGVNAACAYWGLFSDNTAEDATTGYCSAQFLGCNVEGFGQVGIRNKQNSAVFQKTTVLAHQNNVVGIQIEPLNQFVAGSLDTDAAASSTSTNTLVFTVAPSGSSGGTLTSVWLGQTGPWPVTLSTAQVITMTLTYNSTAVTWTTAVTGTPTVTATTSAFKFGYPVHTAHSVNLPFTTVVSPFSDPQFNFWSDTQAQVVGMTTDQYEAAFPPALGVTNRYSKTFYDVNVQGGFHNSYAGTQALAGVTSQAVTFTVGAPTATYRVTLSQSATSVSPPWVTAKGTGGFTINFAASYTGNVDWEVIF